MNLGYQCQYDKNSKIGISVKNLQNLSVKNENGAQTLYCLCKGPASKHRISCTSYTIICRLRLHLTNNIRQYHLNQYAQSSPSMSRCNKICQGYHCRNYALLLLLDSVHFLLPAPSPPQPLLPMLTIYHSLQICWQSIHYCPNVTFQPLHHNVWQRELFPAGLC